MDDKHHLDIDLYKEKIKHLLFEQQDELTQQKTQTERELESLRELHRSEESEIVVGRREHFCRAKETELSHEEFLRKLMEEHGDCVAALRREYRQRSAEVALRSERLMKGARDEIDKKKRDGLKSLEERKDIQTKEVMRRHEQVS